MARFRVTANKFNLSSLSAESANERLYCCAKLSNKFLLGSTHWNKSMSLNLLMSIMSLPGKRPLFLNKLCWCPIKLGDLRDGCCWFENNNDDDDDDDDDGDDNDVASRSRSLLNSCELLFELRLRGSCQLLLLPLGNGSDGLIEPQASASTSTSVPSRLAGQFIGRLWRSIGASLDISLSIMATNLITWFGIDLERRRDWVGLQQRQVIMLVRIKKLVLTWPTPPPRPASLNECYLLYIGGIWLSGMNI